MQNENETETWERPSFYAVIPADVRYSQEVTANAKLLFAEITALCNKTGTCWASNKHFSELYNVNVTTVSDWVSQLVAAGFVSTKVVKGSTGSRRYLRIVADPLREIPKGASENSDDSNTKTNKSLNGDLVKKKDELLSLVNKVTGRNFRTLPEKGSKKTLDLFTFGEIEAALTALKSDSWHAPKLKELSIDYFIRSTTIDKFKDMGIAAKPADFSGTDSATGKSYYKGTEITIENQEEITRLRMGETDGTQ